MTRVLEIFGEPISYGGQESFFFNVLQNINMDNLQIDVFTPYYCDNEISRKLVEKYGGKLIEAKLDFQPGKSRANIIKPLISYLKNKNYNVVHVHSGSTSVLALASMAAKRCKIKKIIVHSHCTGVEKNLKYKLTKCAMTPLLDYCPTDYCACSIEAGEWRFSSRAIKNLVILKNGIDLDKFRYSPEIRQKMRNRLGIKPNDYVIGHVGRFNFQKNQEYIVELLKGVKLRLPDAKVLLIGAGETQGKIKDLFQENNLQDDVIFTGNVNNVQDYLQAMDIFVFPSRFEGLGIVGVEAQANGLLVIASTNVPKELGITPLVQFLDLASISKWEQAIIDAKTEERSEVKDIIRKAGYDITTTASYMRSIYLE